MTVAERALPPLSSSFLWTALAFFFLGSFGRVVNKSPSLGFFNFCLLPTVFIRVVLDLGIVVFAVLMAIANGEDKTKNKLKDLFHLLFRPNRHKFSLFTSVHSFEFAGNW
jgi:hypothetical protein